MNGEIMSEDEKPVDEDSEAPAEDSDPADDKSAADAEAVEHADGETDSDAEAEEVEEAETTPGGSEEGDAELADLRAKIIEQAALIETYRNKLAELGIDADEADTSEAEPEVADTPSEEETVAAFDADYAKQQAMLAALTQEN